MLERLHDLIEGERNVNAAINTFNFSEAAALLYDFVWNEFAARFVEASKTDFAESDSSTRGGTLATFDYVMSHVLRLLHPFAPFVTEELWCELGFGTETIQTTLWPKQSPRSKNWTPRARDIYATADAGRQLRGEVKIPSNQKVPFALVTKGDGFTDEELSVLAALLNASDVQVHTHAAGKSRAEDLHAARRVVFARDRPGRSRAGKGPAHQGTREDHERSRADAQEAQRSQHARQGAGGEAR